MGAVTPRRVLAVSYLAACGLLVVSLAAELGLAVHRTWGQRQAERHRAANVFEKGRDVLEGAGETLWLHPGVRYRPGARLALDVAGERYEIAINSHGFRSPETTVAKPPGVRRVVCLGGSTTVQGRTDADTYPALLERELRAARPGLAVEVLNLGINGITSDHWLTRLDEVFRFEPDVVVQYEFVNDLFFRHLPRYAEDHPRWAMARRSLLLARLFPPAPEDLEPYARRTLRNIRQLGAEAHARGARHVLGTFAGPEAAHAPSSFRHYLDLNVEAWGGRHGVRSYGAYDALRRDFNARLRKAAGEGRLVVAPLDEALRDPALYVDLCHATSAGIATMARAFAPVVLGALEPPAPINKDAAEAGHTGRPLQ